MKFIIHFHIYFLFTIGTIFCIVGVLIMMGVSHILSGVLPRGQTSSLLLGATSLISIASGSKIIVEGILINCFSLTMWMLQKIAFRQAKIIKPPSPPSN